jgi:DNA polymerase-3 subunit alpha
MALALYQWTLILQQQLDIERVRLANADAVRAVSYNGIASSVSGSRLTPESAVEIDRQRQISAYMSEVKPLVLMWRDAQSRAERGVPEKKAARIWDHMEQFAGYGFNKSHSAAYAWLAYQTAYLKANYPAYFMAALLTSERATTDKLVQYIGECREMGIRVLPPDVNLSQMFFAVSGDDIRFGLAAIKNVGEGAVEAVLAVRAEGRFRSLVDFCERVDLKAVNRRVMESFVKSGCFDSLSPRRAALMAGLDRALDAGQKQQRDRAQGQANLFGLLATPDRPAAPESLPEVPDWGEGERLAYEKESLGFFVSGHPLERFRQELQQWATATVGQLAAPGESREVAVGGIVTALRSLKTKKGDRMAAFMLEDEGGSCEVVVFPETYKRAAQHLADDQVVLVKGKAECPEDGKPRVLATEVLPLEQAKLADARFVTIRVPTEAWDRAKGERLREILGAHRGDCPVTLELVRPGAWCVSVAPSAFFKVRPDAGFKTAIEGLLGPGSLRLARSNGAAARN